MADDHRVQRSARSTGIAVAAVLLVVAIALPASGALSGGKKAHAAASTKQTAAKASKLAKSAIARSAAVLDLAPKVGAAGGAGTPGSAGGKGDAGAAGAAGAKGDKGATGGAGANGNAGNNGADGQAGSNGQGGNTGVAGQAGTQGNAGAQGPAGSAGTNGLDGARIVARARGTSSKSTCDNPCLSPNYPLTTGSSWSQPTSETGVIVARVTFTPPGTCTGSTGLLLNLVLNGDSIGSFQFSSSATSPATAQSVLPIFPETAAADRTITVTIGDVCGGAGQNFTVNSVSLDVAALR